jgi:hypothetical protein
MYLYLAGKRRVNSRYKKYKKGKIGRLYNLIIRKNKIFQIGLFKR